MFVGTVCQALLGCTCDCAYLRSSLEGLSTGLCLFFSSLTPTFAVDMYEVSYFFLQFLQPHLVVRLLFISQFSMKCNRIIDILSFIKYWIEVISHQNLSHHTIYCNEAASYPTLVTCRRFPTFLCVAGTHGDPGPGWQAPRGSLAQGWLFSIVRRLRMSGAFRVTWRDAGRISFYLVPSRAPPLCFFFLFSFFLFSR